MECWIISQICRLLEGMYCGGLKLQIVLFVNDLQTSGPGRSKNVVEFFEVGWVGSGAADGDGGGG